MVNSTIVPLSSNETFTGEGEINGHTDVLVTCKTDADGILYVEFSIDDGNHYDVSIPYIVTADIGEFHTLIKGPRTCRIRYVNGSTPQTYLRLQTVYSTFRLPNSGLSTPIQQDTDALTVRAITEESAIVSGLFTGYSITNKFGTNEDIDTGTLPKDIWENGGVYTGFPDTTLETVEILSDSASDTAAGTGARTIRITGLDSGYNIQQETITLNGTTPVASVNQYRRIHTGMIVTAGIGGVNVGNITVRHSATEANIFLFMLPGRNQTNYSAFTVPSGHTAYMRYLHGSIRGTTQAVTPAVVEGNIWTRPFEGVFRSRRPFVISSSCRLFDVIYGGLQFTEKTDIILRITTASGNNISVSGGYDLIITKN